MNQGQTKHLLERIRSKQRAISRRPAILVKPAHVVRAEAVIEKWHEMVSKIDNSRLDQIHDAAKAAEEMVYAGDWDKAVAAVKRFEAFKPKGEK